MFKLVACVDIFGALGNNNNLVFNIKEDMEIFKRLTMGNVVIMGLNTWNSLPEKFRPLPGRENIVITKSVKEIDGTKIYNDIDLMINNLKDENKELWIIGGAQLYNYFLHEHMELIDEIHLTEVKRIAQKADAFLDIKCIIDNYKKETILDNDLFQYNLYKK